VAAELGRKQFEELALVPGDDIFVWPQSIRLFENAEDASLLLDQGAGI